MTNNLTRTEMASVDSWLAAAYEAEFDATQTLLRYWNPRKERRWSNEQKGLVTVTVWSQISESYDWPQIDRAVAKLARAERVIDACNRIFDDNGGWSRFFLVTNNNGHVHRERRCSTCFPTTRYAWLVELAGADEAEMVATYGSDACTVCFPSAPTLPGWGSSKSKRDKDEAKAAKIAARDAKKAADAARNNLLTPVVLPGAGWKGRDEIVTRLAEARQKLKWERNEDLRMALANAIAEKTGKTVAQVLKAASK